jgi:hypothetical protein
MLALLWLAPLANFAEAASASEIKTQLGKVSDQVQMQPKLQKEKPLSESACTRLPAVHSTQLHCSSCMCGLRPPSDALRSMEMALICALHSIARCYTAYMIQTMIISEVSGAVSCIMQLTGSVVTEPDDNQNRAWAGLSAPVLAQKAVTVSCTKALCQYQAAPQCAASLLQR